MSRRSARISNVIRTLASALLLAGGLLTSAAPSGAQEIQTGAGEYMAWCSRCHGTTGKGDGPLAAGLETALPDLTQLSRRNDGSFPAEKVRDTIDGRDMMLAHRSEEMPAWGNWFEYDITAGGLLKQSESKTAAEIDERIDRIVSYLESIQE